jgi:hypothetical protein
MQCHLRHDRQAPSARHVDARRSGAFARPRLSTPLAAGEAVFPGKTWEMPGAPPAGWDAERLRVAEARFQALRPTGFMVVHDGRVVAAWGDVARTVNVHSISKRGCVYQNINLERQCLSPCR